jgi:hypothetical protein
MEEQALGEAAKMDAELKAANIADRCTASRTA